VGERQPILGRKKEATRIALSEERVPVGKGIGRCARGIENGTKKKGNDPKGVAVQDTKGRKRLARQLS